MKHLEDFLLAHPAKIIALMMLLLTLKYVMNLNGEYLFAVFIEMGAYFCAFVLPSSLLFHLLCEGRVTIDMSDK